MCNLALLYLDCSRRLHACLGPSPSGSVSKENRGGLGKLPGAIRGKKTLTEDNQPQVAELSSVVLLTVVIGFGSGLLRKRVVASTSTCIHLSRTDRLI